MINPMHPSTPSKGTTMPSIIDKPVPATLEEATARKAAYMQATKDLDYRDRPEDGGYSINEMHVLFTKVQNPANWKFPINYVGELTTRERHILQFAVPHFTGGSCEFIDEPGGKTRVVAAGYYACIGA